MTTVEDMKDESLDNAVTMTQSVLDVAEVELIKEKFLETFTERLSWMLTMDQGVIDYAIKHGLSGGAIGIGVENEITDNGVARMSIIIPGATQYDLVVSSDHKGLRLRYGDPESNHYTRVETKQFDTDVFKDAKGAANLIIALHEMVSRIGVDALARINGLKEGRLSAEPSDA